MNNRSCPATLCWLFALAIAFATACTSPSPTESEIAQVTQCGSNLIEGVDVHTSDDPIDWTMLRASGRQFAFIKATQGTYNQQSGFAADWAQARAAGLVRSPYHFFDGTDDGVAQANAFLAQLGSGGGLEVGDLPPMLDLECPTASTQDASDSSCEYTGSSGWVPPSELSQRVFDWLDTVHAATGMTPIIYSFESWFASTTLTDPQLASYPLFIASYNSCATVPAPWTAAAFWQYGDDGTVPGISGQVDVDRFFGSAGDLAALTLQPASVSVDAGIRVDAESSGDASSGSSSDMSPEAPSGRAGCQSSSASSSWWLVGLLAMMARSRMRRRIDSRP